MTIRAFICLAAIAGTLGFFAGGSAHADTRLGVALKAAARPETIVAKVGFYKHCRRDEERVVCYRSRRHRCYEHHHYERKRCYYRRRHHRRHVHRHKHPHRPHYGRNYEIYSYKRRRAVAPNTNVQWVYGRYKGYYYPYPYYPAGY